MTSSETGASGDGTLRVAPADGAITWAGDVTLVSGAGSAAGVDADREGSVPHAAKMSAANTRIMLVGRIMVGTFAGPDRFPMINDLLVGCRPCRAPSPFLSCWS